jgi:hypothetical protein
MTVGWLRRLLGREKERCVVCGEEGSVRDHFPCWDLWNSSDAHSHMTALLREAALRRQLETNARENAERRLSGEDSSHC